MANGERRTNGKLRKKFLERQSTETCSLDVAEDGPRTEEEVGALLGVCRQAVSVIEIRALQRLRDDRVFRELTKTEES